MQVDPKHRRQAVSLPRNVPWRDRSGRFALLPLALALLPAGLLSACTATSPTPGAKTLAAQVSARITVPAAPRHFPSTQLHAEQGDVDAMFRLALMLETGTAEVAQDRTQMLRWLALASALGNGPASHRLYLHYEEEPRGRDRALRFKDLAQRQGYFGPVSAQSSR